MQRNDILEILDDAPQNLTIFDSLLITDNKLKRYRNIMCSVSGGADSDIVVDICTKVDRENKIKYVFFDTGLEYEATKKHLKYLEEKYNIKIEVEKAIKPIPLCCRKYGQPFISKQVSEYISRLQRHNFKWEDRPYEELIKEYPNCKSSLKWWCNVKGGHGIFNISRNKWLKEFMIENPPTFLISNKCCTYAKKYVASRYKESNNIDLSITGIRKAEGGIRSAAYKNCFTSNSEKGKADEYRVVFWYKEEDKKKYEEHYNIMHSQCYSKYGMGRTGCAGCPYGKDFEKELEIIRENEPKLYGAVNKVFGDSYEYTRAYRRFKEIKNADNRM